MRLIVRMFDFRENFYTLAWTTLTFNGDEKSNILVSGGIRGEVRMFHPQNKVCFHEWRPVDKKGIAVNSLIFHSEKTTWLFCKLFLHSICTIYKFSSTVITSSVNLDGKGYTSIFAQAEQVTVLSHCGTSVSLPCPLTTAWVPNSWWNSSQTTETFITSPGQGQTGGC